MALRITTWNVNGIRNPFAYQPWRDKRTFEAMFDVLEADIVVMQETKIQRKDLRDDMVLVPGWDVFFSLPKHKKGYSGVAIYTRNAVCAPIRAEEGITGILCPPNSSTSFCNLPEDQQIGGYPSVIQLSECQLDATTIDSEGRCMILEFQAFVLIGVYSPAHRDETRDDFRMSFLTALDARVRNLVAAGKRVFLTGDLNISREEIDSAHAEEHLRKHGMAREDYLSTPARRLFNQLLVDGKVVGDRDEGREEAVLWDICRGFHPGRKGMFTCWETKINARPGNFGSRIDYVLCSQEWKDWFSDSDIQEGLLGSDHCPVYAVIKDVVDIQGSVVHIRDIMNPAGMFKGGVRQREWSTKDLLPMSAKLIPEFDRRRNIRDMFTKGPSLLPGEGPARAVKEDGKRPMEPSPSRSLKRSKSSGSKTTIPTVGKSQTVKGQSSLTGFFKPKSPAPTGTAASADGASQDSSSPQVSTRLEDQEDIIDPIVAKESWSRLLSKRVVPRCEHGDPCISYQTKKAGVNCGRSFYMCARPLGPSGVKEKGSRSQWRCGTFVWSSDWTGGSGDGDGDGM